MLYAPLGVGKPLRVQGAFVSDEEREHVIDFIKQGTTPEYDDEILRQIEKAAAGKDAPEDKDEDGHSAALDDNPFSGCDERCRRRWMLSSIRSRRPSPCCSGG